MHWILVSFAFLIVGLTSILFWMSGTSTQPFLDADGRVLTDSVAEERRVKYGKKIVLYSIQTLKRRKPSWFREDMTTLFKLLSDRKIKPVIAARMPLTEAVQAHKLVSSGSVIALLCHSPKNKLQ